MAKTKRRIKPRPQPEKPNLARTGPTKFPTLEMDKNTPHRANGRELPYGAEFTVKGKRGGRFRFMGTTTNVDSGEQWISAYGGRGGIRQFRSFPVDVTMIVHDTLKLSADDAKMKRKKTDVKPKKNTRRRKKK